MKGREGKIFVCKRYVFEIDRWDWFATCWTGDKWYIWQSYTLPGLVDWVIATNKLNASL